MCSSSRRFRALAPKNLPVVRPGGEGALSRLGVHTLKGPLRSPRIGSSLNATCCGRSRKIDRAPIDQRCQFHEFPLFSFFCAVFQYLALGRGNGSEKHTKCERRCLERTANNLERV
eukprot:6475469-Amphidinium_carterae.2